MNFYLLEGVNLFAGDHDPTASLHLKLDELKLPVLQRNFADHTPGGSPFTIQISTGLAALEATFKLTGFDPALMSQFGYGTRQGRRYTAYGAWRDKRSGVVKQSRAVIEAQMGKIEGDPMKRGDLVGHEYALNEILHYELWFDGQEILALDYWTNLWRVNGADENRDVNNALMIP